jgi:hypothetical protein
MYDIADRARVLNGSTLAFAEREERRGEHIGPERKSNNYLASIVDGIFGAQKLALGVLDQQHVFAE